MGQLVESVVDFICGDALEKAPQRSRDTAALGFTDAVGVMLAGAAEPVTRNLLAFVGATGGQATSRLTLSTRKGSVAQAALVGTAAAHALDFDDYAYSNHVSALLVPAILADAERTGASGREMTDAYLAGYEVWGAIMKREPDHLHSKGWHPTGVFGPIGVAAALARLRRLDSTTTRHALGLAAAAGGGVMDNFGTQAKAYQGARAAEAGVVAVELAGVGLDAGPNAIDGAGGLLAALSPRGRVDLTSPGDWLGHKWLSDREGLNIKLHPTVGASQRGIDAAMQIHRDHGPASDDIVGIIACVSEKHAAVMRFHRPKDALEAKFSLEFGVVAALVAGKVGLRQVTDEFVQRADVQRLMSCVTIEIGPDNDPTYPVGAIADTVAVTLADGRIIESEPVHRFRGHGMNPMTRDELREKFDECVRTCVDHATGARLFDALQSLDTLSGVHALPSFQLAPSQ